MSVTIPSVENSTDFYGLPESVCHYVVHGTTPKILSTDFQLQVLPSWSHPKLENGANNIESHKFHYQPQQLQQHTYDVVRTFPPDLRQAIAASAVDVDLHFREPKPSEGSNQNRIWTCNILPASTDSQIV